MSTEQLAEAAVSLPPAERMKLVRRLWESLHDELPAFTEEESLAVARRRARELDAGTAAGVPHDEMMSRVRRASGCR